MLKEVVEELEKLLELKFSPALHIMGEIEKLIERIKLSKQKGVLIKQNEIAPKIIKSKVSLKKVTKQKIESDGEYISTLSSKVVVTDSSIETSEDGHNVTFGVK